MLNAKPSALVSAPSSPTFTFLIIEDSPMNQTVIGALLRSLYKHEGGCNLLFASNNLEAEALFTENIETLDAI